MKLLSFLCNQTHKQSDTPENTKKLTSPRTRLRDALLECSTLTKEEVDEYINYEFEGIVRESVPLDFELTNDEDAEITCLYADGILCEKIVKRHTNQISPETLKKVRRVLPLILLEYRGE